MKLALAKQYFRGLIKQNHLSHAYLLTGEGHQTKAKLTQAIIQDLACPNKDESGQACLSCSICQKVERGQFVDHYVVKPDGRSIKVEQIRQLKHWLTTSPMEANFKIASIEQADLLSASAANALLLFLEEPGENVYLFLLANQSDELLPTIRSRTQELRVDPISMEEIVQQMVSQGLSKEHAVLMTCFSAANRQLLLADYQEETFSRYIQALDQFLIYLLAGKPRSFVWVQQGLKEFLNFKFAVCGVDYLMAVAGALLLDSYLDKTDYLKGHFQSRWEEFKQIDEKKVFDFEQSLLKCKEFLMANVTPQLAYEQLALDNQIKKS
ncbi:DNA polymerase III subunit delta' [Facklamia hominis]|uniref:DNA polymerase III subunit delta' n=1 Tax=Facklamia hominis TaxID=178214 RepID=UPI000C7DF203|nr:DNA polymerase III subunit delta' [Facklamia hominis]PKY92539.1 DNA polymerase III subunit delta' [Facklamia hominis]